VFFQHFMGTLDDHDPGLSEAFADDREVIAAQRGARSVRRRPGPQLRPPQGHRASRPGRQGSHDIVIPTSNSYILEQFLSTAELILYPDASYGSHFQYPNCSSVTRPSSSTISSPR
jgi:hypothetical protein